MLHEMESITHAGYNLLLNGIVKVVAKDYLFGFTM